MKMGDRPTGDLIVLLFAVAVVVMILIVEIGAIVIELVAPEVDTTEILSALADHIGTLIGVIIGYLGGRGATAGLDRARQRDQEVPGEPPARS